MLPFIPAALATLMLVNNNLVPQLGNGPFQITTVSVFQGAITLTLSGNNGNDNPVSANLVMLLAPGEVFVLLPGGFLPVTFIINMQPIIHAPAFVPPSPSQPFVFLPPDQNQANPLTGQLEPVGSF